MTDLRDNIEARVLAMIARSGCAQWDVTNPRENVSDLCDDRRENIEELIRAFASEFQVDMTNFDFGASFPQKNINWLEAVAHLFVFPMLIGAPIIAAVAYLFGFTPGFLITLPLWFVCVLISARLAGWVSEIRPGRRNSNAVTVQNLIDAAIAKRWPVRTSKAPSP